MFSKPQHYVLPLFALLLFACEPETLTAPTPADAETAQLETRLAEIEADFDAELVAMEAEWSAWPKAATVTVPAGSSDALAAAIAEAGENGTVVLAAGMHTESATVMIPHRIRLRGEDGAVLVFDSGPFEGTGIIEVGLHVQGAPRTLIQNLEMRVTGAVGGAAILFERSDFSAALRNTITDYQFGILIQHSDRVYAIRNEIAASPLWQTGEITQSFGMIVINGRQARIYSNKLSGGITGVWACDRNGYLAGNELFGNLEGIILCRVPVEYNYTLPNGDVMFAEVSGAGWSVFSNDAHDNIQFGYQIIDGANRNFIVKNTASNNGQASYEFAGETGRFGLPNNAPTTFGNTAWIDKEDTYLDCGEENRIFGGEFVELCL